MTVCEPGESPNLFKQPFCSLKGAARLVMVYIPSSAKHLAKISETLTIQAEMAEDDKAV
jgi:hypothetical protein